MVFLVNDEVLGDGFEEYCCLKGALDVGGRVCVCSGDESNLKSWSHKASLLLIVIAGLGLMFALLHDV